MAIAWIDGQWGSPHALGLSLADRGLQLADGLFETLLVEGGRAWLLEEHLGRWQRSAALLALPPPPGFAIVQPLISEAIARSGIVCGALRLNWSRGGGTGGGGRGIAIAGSGPPGFWLQLSTAAPSFTPLRVIVSPTERRCATSVLSQCKTFAYGPSIQAHRQAQAAGADDALLPSSSGELSCGTTSNLVVRSGSGSGTGWITPPLSRVSRLDQHIEATALSAQQPRPFLFHRRVDCSHGPEA